MAAETSSHKPPMSYKVQVDKDVFETKDPTPTGRELLLLARKVPPEQFAIYRKPKEGPDSVGTQ